MKFTAYVRGYNLKDVSIDSRLDVTPVVGIAPTDETKMYLQTDWTPSFDIAGSHFIIMKSTDANLTYAGGLIVGEIPPDCTLLVAGDPTAGYLENLTPDATNPEVNDGTRTYYTKQNGVIKEVIWNVDDDVETGIIATQYYIELSAPLYSPVWFGSEYKIFKFSSTTEPQIEASDFHTIDLRRHMASVNFTSSIDVGYDTATISLNESASSLGKYYSYMLGQNITICDIWGNVCWDGIVVSTYMDGGGGRIDAIGFKHTFQWFRFDQVYLRSNGAWPDRTKLSDRTQTVAGGPTSPYVLIDVMKANPYIKQLSDAQVNKYVLNVPFNPSIPNDTTNSNWPDLQGTTGDFWDDLQLAVTSNNGLDELDFSSGSYKCSDAIATIERFGFYGEEGVTGGFSDDTMYLQCWAEGYCRVIRVHHQPDQLQPDIIIPRAAVSKDYQGVEIAGDINDLVTESYVIYNDAEGNQLVSQSTYNPKYLERYGVRTLVQTGDIPNATLAAVISNISRSDHGLVVGIGNVQVTGNVKGYGGQQRNIPNYLIRAGRIIQFEENLGFASLYRNRNGIPGIFYVGSASYDSTTDTMTLTPATTLSAVELFLNRQSDITN